MHTAQAGNAGGSRPRIGLVGARGHVGAELIALLAAHPVFQLAFVSSRERDGQAVRPHVPAAPADLHYCNLDPRQVGASGVEAVVLALPNGKAAAFVSAIDAVAPGMVVVDLSADFRFDPGWHYGLPERTRTQAAGHRRISNPGCYATAMQLAVAPMLDALDGPVQCFGVSGYSGAGTAPSPRNDPEALRDNLIPYALAGHVHEAEASHRLQHPIEFMPHVAPHFRGLTVTVNMHLAAPTTPPQVRARYRAAYAGEPLVRVLEEAPWVSRIANRHHVEIGGLALSPEGRRLVVAVTLDNLLKGAATQALQNLNLAFALPEHTGIPE